MNQHETAHELLPELGEVQEFPEGECELEGEAFLGGLANIALNAARSVLGGALGESEGESDGEAELNPVRRWYADAMLEHLAHEAAQAESEDEAAEAFLPLIPLVAAKLLPLAAKSAPLVAKALPKVMSVVNRVGPQLTRGIGNVARTLFRNPRTRPLLRTLPSIAQRAVGALARQAVQGHPVTPQSALRALAQQTGSFLRQAPRCRAAVRRSRWLDQQAHRLAGTAPQRTGSGCGCRCGCPGCGG
jgi:hypothetical protein